MPRSTAPASRSLRTTVASAPGTKSRCSGMPDRRDHAFGAAQVLHRDRHAVQLRKDLAPPDHLLGIARLRQGELRRRQRIGFQGRVETLDAPQHLLRQLDRRHLAGDDQLGEFGNLEKVKLRSFHRDSLRSVGQSAADRSASSRVSKGFDIDRLDHRHPRGDQGLRGAFEGFDLREIDAGNDAFQRRHVDPIAGRLDDHAVGQDGRQFAVAAVLAVFLVHRAGAVLVDLLDLAVGLAVHRHVGPAGHRREAAHAAQVGDRQPYPLVARSVGGLRR